MKSVAMRYSLLYAIILLMFSCKKGGDSKVNPIPDPIIELELIWEAKAVDQSVTGEGLAPMVYGDKVIFTGGSRSGKASIKCFDAETGDLIWELKDFISVNMYSEESVFEKQFAVDGKYIIGGEYKTAVIDIESGGVIWESPYGSGENFNLAGGYLYRSVGPYALMFPFYNKLVRASVEVNDWKEVLSLEEDSNSFKSDILGPALWMSPTGDSVLICIDRKWTETSDPYENSRFDLIGYNLSRGTIEFKIQSIENVFAAIPTPLVDGDHLYLTGTEALYCIDLLSHNFLWKKYLEDEIYTPVIEGNVILIQARNSLYALEKHTGDVLWESKRINTIPSRPKVYDDVIYFTTRMGGYVYGVNAKNGQHVLNLANAYSGLGANGFHSGLDIHGKLKYIYVHDNLYLKCFKLPEY